MIKKIIISILIVFILYSICISNICNAENGFSAASITKTNSVFESTGKDTKITNFANKSAVTAIAIMRIVGVAIAVVMLLAVSIKYMVSSAGDRADIKKHAIVYVVGAIVLFGAVGILGVIENLTSKSLE